MKARLIQVLVRWIGFGLAFLTAKMGIETNADDIVIPIATGLGTLICVVADHYIHRVQQKVLPQ